MIKGRTSWLAFAAALGVGLSGCGDDGADGPGGSGGSGGAGGTGGMEPGTAMVTVVHLAPEIPAAEDTNVDILVNGATAIEDLAYGESTGRVTLDAGDYTFGVAVAGQTQPVLELPATLSDGDDLTVVAYRTHADPFVSVFVFSNRTDGLASGQGRVFVGHGANDSLLDPVDIIVTDEAACPPALLDEFAFGTTAPSDGNLDLGEGTVNIGFDLSPGDCTAEAGPVAVPVTADVVSILVAVDEDAADESLAPQLWAIVDASDTPLRLINP
jgi:hypothetical protein